MTISDSVTKAFCNYDNFTGRAPRAEYWSFVFFSNFVLLVVSITLFKSFLPLMIVATILSIPGPAIAVRRLHDVGRSGLWLLALLIPLITFIMMIKTHFNNDPSAIIWSTLCLVGLLISYFPARWLNSPGQVGDNEFGPDPMHQPNATNVKKPTLVAPKLMLDT